MARGHSRGQGPFEYGPNDGTPGGRVPTITLDRVATRSEVALEGEFPIDANAVAESAERIHENLHDRIKQGLGRMSLAQLRDILKIVESRDGNDA